MPRPVGPPPPLTLYGCWDACERLGDPDALVHQVVLLERSVDEMPAVALDTSKSIIETVCKTVLESRGVGYDDDIDIPALVKYALRAVRITGDDLPEALATSMYGLGSGMVRVAQHLGELRNKGGLIGHGRGAQERFIGRTHALYAARSADALVQLIVTAHVEEPSQTPPLPVYGDYRDFDDWTDEVYEGVTIYDAPYQASEVLFRVDPIAYEAQRVIFEAERADIDEPLPPLRLVASIIAQIALGSPETAPE